MKVFAAPPRLATAEVVGWMALGAVLLRWLLTIGCSETDLPMVGETRCSAHSERREDSQ